MKTAGGLAGISVLTLPALGQGDAAFYLEQSGRCWAVEPLAHDDETVPEFYGYSSAHAHPSTDILESDTSHLFLYEDPTGELSVVAIHDIPSHDDHGSEFDTGGGAVTFEFESLPGFGSWVVKDDPGDTYGSTQTDWTWATRNTDGGAFGPLETRGSERFDFVISPFFNEAATRDPLDPGEISFWCFLSGDATDPDEVLLDMDEDVRLVHTDDPPCEEPVTELPDECVSERVIDIKPCSDPNAINPNSKGVIPVGIQGSADFDVEDVVVDSLRFGAIGHVEAAPAHDGHIEDTVPCGGDGIDDLVAHFPVEDTGFTDDSELGKLTGRLEDGSSIIGFDTVKIVGGGGGPP